MARKEFSLKVKKAAYERSGAMCEGMVERDGAQARCGVDLTGRKKAFDHIQPDGLGGKPTLENCQVLCLPCHKAKTNVDTTIMRKADAQKAQANQIVAPKQKIQSRGFPKKAKTSRYEGLPELPRMNRQFQRMLEE